MPKLTKLTKLQNDWDDLAEIDPMWAICSDAEKMQGRWNRDEFFATGRDQIRKVLDTIQTYGLNVRTGTALDFGCGMGRLTQALAAEFDRVYGVDISERMIHYANQYNAFGDKCVYVLNTSSDLQVFEDGMFDFIYTYIVLQHMPSELMLGYLKEFIRILNQGGIVMFQVPIRRLEEETKSSYLRSLPKFHPRRVLNKLESIFIGHDMTDRYYKLRRLGIPKTWLYKFFGFRPEIQMHTLNEAVITKLLLDSGAEIIHIEKQEDELSKMLHGEFIVRKPA